MVNMGSLIEFLKREVALNALEKSINHAKIVQSCVEELGRGLNLLLQDRKPEEAQEVFHQVDIIENNADKLRREIQKDISKGELNPSVRQNLSHLVKRMDDVANCCTGVARRINTVPEKFWEQTSQETLKIVLEMMDATIACSKYLDKIVIDLLEERKHIKEYSKQINQYEHKVDLLNIDLRRNLQLTHYDVNQFTVFTVGNIFDILEAISDSIEGVADYIMVLVTSAESL
jgi:predicted phosphate transport protein (TIGR00153 family)